MGKRGPKKQKGKREPNGRLSRQEAGPRNMDALDMEERTTIEVGIEARQRVFGVSARDSRDQLAGSVVGRLCLTGEISRVQYDAAQAWLECREAYLRAVAPAVGRQPGAVNPNATHGQSNYENVGASVFAVSRYNAAQEAIQERQNELRLGAHLNGALDAILVRDAHVEHLVGNLRTALNALARHFKLDGRRAA